MKRLLWLLIGNIFVSSHLFSSERALIRVLHRQDSTGKKLELYDDIKAHIIQFIRSVDDSGRIDWSGQIDAYIDETSPCCCISLKKETAFNEFKQQALKIIYKIQEAAKADYAMHRDQFMKALDDDNPMHLFQHAAEVSSLEPINYSIRYLAINCLEEALSRNAITCEALNELSDIAVIDSNSFRVLEIIRALNAKSQLKSLLSGKQNIATLAYSKSNFGLIKLLLTIDRNLAFVKDATETNLVELLCRSGKRQLLLDAGITEHQITGYFVKSLAIEREAAERSRGEINELRIELNASIEEIHRLRSEITLKRRQDSFVSPRLDD